MVIKNFGYDDEVYDDNFQQEFETVEKISPVVSQEEAERAANRQYGEPVLWKSDEQTKQEFIEALINIGAKPLQGGRFIHVSGDCNKGSALEWFIAEYARQNPDIKCKSIALGDGQNDVAMLEAAEYAVRILSPVNEPPMLNKTENVITSTKTGPAGWTESLTQIFKNTL